jgi:pyrrolidone-carboxylate peptidase
MKKALSRAWLYASCLSVVMSAVGTPAAAQPAYAGSYPATATQTVEEQRLDLDVPKEILARSGFDRLAARFERALCAAHDLDAARRVVTSHGRSVWRAAVDRAQGRGPDGGDLSRDDDRPLYWARLAMTRAVRAWEPGFPLDEADRHALLDRLERASRGQDTVRFPAGIAIKRILVTGFDPFQLDNDVRRSNPSGAAALALDGTVVHTAYGPARIEAAMFPVRWADFAHGMVESTLLPHLLGGRRKVDLLITISQGRPDQFDVERWNGAWRGGGLDNLRTGEPGIIPIPAGVPTQVPQPQFVPTTLPYASIVAADTGRFPVLDRTVVTEIPAGGTTPVVQPTGPTPGSAARAGGGGNYLSNEIAYRATLLRDAVGANILGGHLHTPVLQFAEDNTSDITDPTFVQNRLDIIDQVRRILIVAAGSADSR